jgi:DNA-binding GntR family transcriptional regulator
VELEAFAAVLAVENRGKWDPAQLTAAAERLEEAARKRDIGQRATGAQVSRQAIRGFWRDGARVAREA